MLQLGLLGECRGGNSPSDGWCELDAAGAVHVLARLITELALRAWRVGELRKGMMAELAIRAWWVGELRKDLMAEFAIRAWWEGKLRKDMVAVVAAEFDVEPRCAWQT